MLLIFPSVFAIGFSVLHTIYRSFPFSCSPLGNQKRATIIRLLFLRRSRSKPHISFFFSFLLSVAAMHKLSISRWNLPALHMAFVMISVMLRWHDPDFALGEILFAELMKQIPTPCCVQEVHGGLCDLFWLLSPRCSRGLQYLKWSRSIPFWRDQVLTAC